jgi:uncharacterized membrane protein YkvA (DUF1232 family)
MEVESVPSKTPAKRVTPGPPDSRSRAGVRALSRRGPHGFGIGARLRSAPRLIRTAWRGSYPYAGRGRLAALAIAVAYIVSPVDVVPELVIPFVGVIDDAGVAVWLATWVLAESDRFLAWERDTMPLGDRPVRRTPTD